MPDPDHDTEPEERTDPRFDDWPVARDDAFANMPVERATPRDDDERVSAADAPAAGGGERGPEDVRWIGFFGRGGTVVGPYFYDESESAIYEGEHDPERDRIVLDEDSRRDVDDEQSLGEHIEAFGEEHGWGWLSSFARAYLEDDEGSADGRDDRSTDDAEGRSTEVHDDRSTDVHDDRSDGDRTATASQGAETTETDPEVGPDERDGARPDREPPGGAEPDASGTPSGDLTLQDSEFTRRNLAESDPTDLGLYGSHTLVDEDGRVHVIDRYFAVDRTGPGVAAVGVEEEYLRAREPDERRREGDAEIVEERQREFELAVDEDAPDWETRAESELRTWHAAHVAWPATD